MKLFLTIISSLLWYSNAQAASCCVANASIPQFMTLPADWQLTTSASFSRIIGDVDTDGRAVFRGDQNKETTVRLSEDLAWRRGAWQILAGAGMSSRTFVTAGKTETSRGFSDASLALTREFEWTEHSLRFYPFYRHVFPTGKAQGSLTDLGSGRAQDSAGLLSMWFGVHWDAQLTIEAHRNGTTERAGTRFSESYGGSLGMGTGYIPFKAQWRLGAQLTVRWEGAGKTRNETGSQYTGRSQVWDTGLNLGRQLGAYQNLAVSYADQTLVGPARNTRLGRTAAVLWQLRI